MAYSAVPTRDTNDSNSFTDINQIQENTSLGKAAIAATTGDFTITDTDGYGIIKYDVSGGTATVTLPTAADNQDREITFMLSSVIAASELIIDGEGAETINGTITATLRSKYDRCKLLCDGTEWYILDMFASYDTGWINRSDWTNVHMGSDDTKDNDSDVDHNLGVNQSDLGIQVLASTDGTDNNGFEINFTYALFDQAVPGAVLTEAGITIFQVDADSVRIQTGADGLVFSTDASGAGQALDTEDWYYKIKVVRKI